MEPTSWTALYDSEGHRTKLVETPASGAAVTREFGGQADAVAEEPVDALIVRITTVASRTAERR